MFWLPGEAKEFTVYRRLDEANFQLQESINASNEAKAAAQAAKAAENAARVRQVVYRSYRLL